MDYPNNDDGRVLASIAATGMDLSKPVTVEFAITSPNESACVAIASSLRMHGFRAEVDYDKDEPDYGDGDGPEFGPSWTVYVPVICVPSYANVVHLQEELNGLSRGFGGSVDGWEVRLTR